MEFDEKVHRGFISKGKPVPAVLVAWRKRWVNAMKKITHVLDYSLSFTHSRYSS